MFDVIVLGGGPAGVTAALRAHELGASVALVERGRLGGTCTNDGCVPTRVLAKAARLMRDAEQYADYALSGEPPALDFPRLLARTQQLIFRVQEKKQLRGHLEEIGVTVFEDAGDCRFADAHTVALRNGATPQAEKFILCVGGQPRRPAFPGSEYGLSHSDVWSLREIPRAMAIVGAAATGCQLASIFEAFGARVTLLEVAPRILPGEDAAVSGELAAVFGRRGIEVRTGIGGVARIEPERAGLRLSYTEGGEARSLAVEAVVLATGWAGNAEELNLGSVGVEVERGFIRVDDTLRTTAPHIYAAGDVTGRMMLVQSSSREALVAAENAVLGGGRAVRHQIVPHGGFTDPKYGSVGLAEHRVEAGAEPVVALARYAELDRALVDGRPEGFCKLIVARGTRRILGAHVVGEQAVEIVQIVAAGMAADTRVDQLADLEFAYPTFTAIVGLAARQAVRRLDPTPPVRVTG